MQKGVELQQILYDLIETQIKFGVHRYGESLPTIKEASSYFLASVDTVRLVYVRLKQEGYISLSSGVGATVRIQYNDEEIHRHIQEYFSCRRSTLLAFAQSFKLLFGYAQWFALKNASPLTLDELERICKQVNIPPTYRMSRQLQLIYGPLGNELLIRLVWQMFLFFQGPFLSVPQNIEYFEGGKNPIQGMICLVREKNWTGLWESVETYEEQRFEALCLFFDHNIPEDASYSGRIDFTWNIYKKAHQVCYSLCMELLTGIREGYYPVGTFLPPPQELAKEKQVGVKTIRRTIQLLGKLGATESINGIGTKVLPPVDNPKNCDFSDTTIRKRLLDFLQSFHLLALSCRACAQITVESMDDVSLYRCLELLKGVRRSGLYETVVEVCFQTISLYAPYQAIRTVYNELARQLFWGGPLRNLHGDRESTNAYFGPYLESLIQFIHRADASGFSQKLEELQIAETKLIAQSLVQLGIREAADLLLQDWESN